MHRGGRAVDAAVAAVRVVGPAVPVARAADREAVVVAMVGQAAARRATIQSARNAPIVRIRNDCGQGSLRVLYGDRCRGLKVIARCVQFCLIFAPCLPLSVLHAAERHERAINSDPHFEGKTSAAKTYIFEGDALFGAFPDARSELAGRGVRFLSSGEGP